MGRFSVRIPILDRLYQFAAGASSAPEDLNTEGSIQVVHEVGRAQELASTIGFPSAINNGFWLIGPQHVHAGADTQRSATNPRNAVVNGIAAGTIQSLTFDFDVWYMGCSSAWEETGLGVITAANSTLWYPIMPGRIAAFPMLLWNSPVSILASDAAGAASIAIQASNAASQIRPITPVYIPVGGTLNHLTTSTAATTVTLADLCWIGAKGARPPAVA